MCGRWNVFVLAMLYLSCTLEFSLSHPFTLLLDRAAYVAQDHNKNAELKKTKRKEKGDIVSKPTQTSANLFRLKRQTWSKHICSIAK